MSKYITPFVFGHGSDHHSYSYNSGTATLTDLGKGPLVLTCEHVTTPFRQFKECHGDKVNAELYIGGATGIDRKIIAWDKALDIATLQLTKDKLTLIPLSQNLCGTKFINEIYTGPIKENDVIVLAGFPREPSWRYKTGVRIWSHFIHAYALQRSSPPITITTILFVNLTTVFMRMNSATNLP